MNRSPQVELLSELHFNHPRACNSAIAHCEQLRVTWPTHFGGKPIISGRAFTLLELGRSLSGQTALIARQSAVQSIAVYDRFARLRIHFQNEVSPNNCHELVLDNTAESGRPSVQIFQASAFINPPSAHLCTTIRLERADSLTERRHLELAIRYCDLDFGQLHMLAWFKGITECTGDKSIVLLFSFSEM